MENIGACLTTAKRRKKNVQWNWFEWLFLSFFWRWFNVFFHFSPQSLLNVNMNVRRFCILVLSQQQQNNTQWDHNCLSQIFPEIFLWHDYRIQFFPFFKLMKCLSRFLRDLEKMSKKCNWLPSFQWHRILDGFHFPRNEQRLPQQPHTKQIEHSNAANRFNNRV